jgi:hypothetical protein
VVLLEGGTVTSCDVSEAPHWRIAATRIYVLAPGEWAITDAVLYVGRIPLLYLPFFFKPGDQFFFHPSIGYRNREGWYIQTTSYLEGTPEPEEGAFSFLRITEEGSTAVNREIRGLFLRVVETEGNQPPPVETGHTLKLLADVYMRLGLFAGVVADYAPLWQLKGGIGVSRTIFFDDLYGIYSPFERIGVSTVDPNSQWNSGLFFGLAIPFRFGIEGNLSLGRGGKTFSGSFAYFSDPFFPEDFYLRSENSLLQGQDVGVYEGGAGAWDLSPTPMESFSWQIRNRLFFPFESSFLQELNLQRFDLSLDWQSKYHSDYPAFIAAEDPSRKFTYPARLILPNAQLLLRGKLLELPGVAAAETEGGAREPSDDEEPGRGFRLPAPEEIEEAPGPEQEEELILPPPKEDLPVTLADPALSTFALTYTFQPRFLLENQFNHPSWLAPAQVDLSSRYTSIDTAADLAFLASFGFGRGYVSGSNRLTLSGAFETSFNRSSDVADPEWTAITDRDRAGTGFDVINALNLNYFPLLPYPSLSTSNIRYELGWKLYRYQWETAASAYRGDLVPWDADAVTRHSLLTRFVYQPKNIAHFFQISAVLPPLEMIFQGQLDFTLWHIRSNITTGIREAGGWLWDPLVITESLKIASWATFSQKLSFDLSVPEFQQAVSLVKFTSRDPEKRTFSFEQELVWLPEKPPVGRSRSSLKWMSWEASFLAEKLVPLTIVSNEWSPSGPDTFLPSRLLVGYRRPIGPAYLWKNRFSVESSLNTSVDLDFQRFTQSVFNFSWDFTVNIHRFLYLSLEVVSWNRKIYLYYQPWATQAGAAWVNPFYDLIRSFNFFDRDDRIASSFNLKSISLTFVHDLHDWDLSFDLSVSQVLRLNESGQEEYQWLPTFNLLLEWHAIPELQKSIRLEEEGLNLRG